MQMKTELEIAIDQLEDAHPCPGCGKRLLCACPSCLLDERQIPPGYGFWVNANETAIIDGEEVELPFAKCNECGYTWEMDSDDDPFHVEQAKQEWPEVIE